MDSASAFDGCAVTVLELFKHVPVMPREAVEFLNIRPGGVYVDGTMGGGGHSGLILERLGFGTLVGIDRDDNAIAAASCLNKKTAASSFSNGDRLLPVENSFMPVRGNFYDMPQILDKLGIASVDGVLLDLGVSSHQIDTPERGFSFRHNGPLDMRMDRDTDLTAAVIVNTYAEKELARILYTYGEERLSRRIARAICSVRDSSPIESTLQLAEIIEKVYPRKKHTIHPATRSFMALRIAVNDELSPLEDALRNITGRLVEGGRLVVITFHSLEDRIVKSTFASLAAPCICPRDIPYCACGKKPELRVLTRKPIVPTEEELAENSRAHSAKLRAGERIVYGI